MDNILLFDFANAVWRASMSWGNKEEPQDEVMIYNFFRNLRPLVEMFQPHKIFFVLEGHPKHRYEVYADYKANRIFKMASKQDAKEKFYKSQNEIIRLAKYLPVTFCRAADYECDDVIATLAENLKQENVTIISNDSDYIQLLQRGYKNCKVYNPIKKKFMETPDYHYLTFKILNGDVSDNVPGLVTEKIAKQLACSPHTLSKWIKLEENRANFNINKKLIEFAIVPEDQIEVDDGVSNFKQLKLEFQNLKFESFMKDATWNKFCKTFDCVSF
jgi:5'-3' exonuclease